MLAKFLVKIKDPKSRKIFYDYMEQANAQDQVSKKVIKLEKKEEENEDYKDVQERKKELVEKIKGALDEADLDKVLLDNNVNEFKKELGEAGLKYSVSGLSKTITGVRSKLKFNAAVATARQQHAQAVAQQPQRGPGRPQKQPQPPTPQPQPPTPAPKAQPPTPQPQPPTPAPKTQPPTPAPKTQPPPLAPKSQPPTPAPKTQPPTPAPKTQPLTPAPKTQPPPPAPKIQSPPPAPKIQSPPATPKASAAAAAAATPATPKTYGDDEAAWEKYLTEGKQKRKNDRLIEARGGKRGVLAKKVKEKAEQDSDTEDYDGQTASQQLDEDKDKILKLQEDIKKARMAVDNNSLGIVLNNYYDSANEKRKAHSMTLKEKIEEFQKLVADGKLKKDAIERLTTTRGSTMFQGIDESLETISDIRGGVATESVLKGRKSTPDQIKKVLDKKLFLNNKEKLLFYKSYYLDRKTIVHDIDTDPVYEPLRKRIQELGEDVIGDDIEEQKKIRREEDLKRRIQVLTDKGDKITKEDKEELATLIQKFKAKKP
jgi:hypothetical protein